MLAIFKREIYAYLSSMVAYVVMGIFLLVMGLFVWVFPDTSILNYGYASLESMFNLAPLLFVFFIPAIAMRSFAEERNFGTLELLFTRPITSWQIIWGKFLACWLLVLLSLLPTLLYYYSVSKLGMPEGNVDGGAVFGAYLGLLFLGAVFVSIGIFASAVTNNQIIAFAIAVFLSYFSFGGFQYLSKLSFFSGMENAVASIGMNAHYESISRGVVDTRDVIYFVSICALFLGLTKIFIERENER